MKKLYEYFYENDFLALLTTMMTLFTTVILGSLAANGDINISMVGNIPTICFLLIPYFVLVSVIGIDALISNASNSITDGDAQIKSYLWKKIVGSEASEYRFQADVYIAVCTTWLIFISPFVITLSFPAVIPYVIGACLPAVAYFALIKVGNMVYRVNKNLNEHKNDPNAHKSK